MKAPADGDRLRRVADVATIAVALAALGVVAVALWDRSKSNSRARDEIVPEWKRYAVTGNRVGSAQAPVTIVEFGDYECAFCKRFESVVQKVLQSYPEEAAFVYRHNPLPYHQDAYRAARLAECAADQRRFEAAHRTLFEASALTSVDALSVLRQAQVPDSARFLRCASDTIRVPRIEEDIAAARDLGVRATPTVLVNDVRLAGTPDSARLFAAVERALSRAQRRSAVTRRPGAEALALARETHINGRSTTMSSVGGAVMIPPGGIAVAQPSEHLIRFFDSHGRDVGSVGARGSGPGEFAVISRIGTLGDTIWAFDGRLRRFTLFAPTSGGWEYARTVHPSYRIASTGTAANGVAADYAVTPQALYPNGSVQALLQSLAEPKEAGYFVVDSVGRLRNRVASYSSAEHDPRLSYFHRFADGSVRGGIFPLAPLPHRQISSDGALHVVVETEITSSRAVAVTVTLLGHAGDTLYSVRHPFEGSPVPRAEAERRTEETYTRLRGSLQNPDASRALEAAEAWRRSARTPSAYPPLRDVIVGSDSSVWLLMRDSSQSAPLLRLGATGSVSGRAVLPKGSRVLAASSTHIWVVELDYDDVPSLLRYRIM